MKIKKLPPSKLKAFIARLDKHEMTDTVAYKAGTYYTKGRYLICCVTSKTIEFPKGIPYLENSAVQLYADFVKQVIAIKLK
jgi:hypothetical protein